MLWGCFSAAGTEGLIRVEENSMHQNIKIALMKPSPEHSEPQIGQKVTFQQDNDPKHIARVEWLTDNSVKVFE